MEILRIPARNEAIPEGISFLTQALKNKRIGSKEANRAILMAEEAMVKLFQHAPPEATAKLAVVSRMGSLSLKLSVPGPEFEFEKDVDFCMDMQMDEGDSQAEATIRDLLLNAFRDKLRYKNRNRCNIVLISVKESEKQLLYWTVAALISSILLGLLLRQVLPEAGALALNDYLLSPVKTMFLNALKMVVAPVVFFSILSCVSQFSNLADFGKTGGKVMGFYMFTTVVAIAMGTAAFLILRPGQEGAQALTSAGQVVAGAEDVNISILDTIVNIVPSNIVQPFVNADMLQIIFIAILCGIAVGMIGDYSRPLKEFFEGCNTLFLKVTTIIVSVIPLAVFCSVCSLVMLTGGDTLISLIYFLLTVLAGMVGMVAVYSLLILVVARLNPLIFLKKYAPGMLTTFSLGSSNAAMPYNMQICRNDLGISPKVYSFSIPLGATVNMDGTCVYLVVAAMFLARLYGVDLTGSDLTAMFFSVFVLSVGAPGVPGAGLVCLSVLLVQIGVPVEGAGLMMAIDSIVGMFRAASNTAGDVAISLVVARLEHLLDLDVYHKKVV
ncbi:hypothetical protein B5G34_03630 [Flavonifractor sp. An82]|uniref:dicarboxylate/amino acid:cation symporter n=1 Tax=Flavonifractor sp. An82 TaxID=1965660 RepID=UPI000B3AAEFB|nr:dicarboxylate/amino acid:cation symporter [Flavonifractor sp. An82]OUN24181.1 hypothetical protein B5G34_03630 [Flavonifractor sp. An82]